MHFATSWWLTEVDKVWLVYLCATHSSAAMAVVSPKSEAEIWGAVHAHHHLRDWNKRWSFLSQRQTQMISGLEQPHKTNRFTFMSVQARVTYIVTELSSVSTKSEALVDYKTSSSDPDFWRSTTYQFLRLYGPMFLSGLCGVGSTHCPAGGSMLSGCASTVGVGVGGCLINKGVWVDG